MQYWDNGVGIDKPLEQDIYKAFFSSRENHAGLGMYICNELCLLNAAQLEYVSLTTPARFRITMLAGQKAKQENDAMNDAMDQQAQTLDSSMAHEDPKSDLTQK